MRSFEEMNSYVLTLTECRGLYKARFRVLERKGLAARKIILTVRTKLV
jgi:hypothetical protein